MSTCLHKLSIHSIVDKCLGHFGHAFHGRIRARLEIVNTSTRENVNMVMAWSFLGRAHDQRNVLRREGFPGFGHFGHFGPFWAILGHFGHCWSFWVILGDFGSFW